MKTTKFAELKTDCRPSCFSSTAKLQKILELFFMLSSLCMESTYNRKYKESIKGVVFFTNYYWYIMVVSNIQVALEKGRPF
jgi:hypothetical protein